MLQMETTCVPVALCRQTLAPLAEVSIEWQSPPLQVLQMERDMLDVLGFELTVPSAKIFLRRYVKATATENGADYHRCAMLAAYLTELTLPDYESLQFLPSQVGAMQIRLVRQCCPQQHSRQNLAGCCKG